MDQELFAYLEAMRREILSAVQAGDEALEQRLVKAIEDGDRQTRVLIEEVDARVTAMGDGIKGLREEMNRRFKEHDEKWDLRIGPLEAVVRSHSDLLYELRVDLKAEISSRIGDLERRVTAIEQHGA